MLGMQKDRVACNPPAKVRFLITLPACLPARLPACPPACLPACFCCAQFERIKRRYPHAVLGWSTKKDCLVTVKGQQGTAWWQHELQ